MVLAVLATLSALPAQTIEGAVVFDQASTQMRYELVLRGQPLDVGLLLASPALLPHPGLSMPPFGTLFLDSGSMFQVFIPLNATGEARLVLPIPADFFFVNVQALFYRPLTQSAVLSTGWVGLGHVISHTDAIKAIGTRNDAASGTLRASVWSRNGDQVRVTVCRDGVPIANGGGVINNNGWENWDIRVAIQKGDVLKIDVNGVNELTKTY